MNPTVEKYVRPLTLFILLGLSACAHDPLDTAEIDAKAVDARNRVNELATELGELATPIMMFCGIVGDEDKKCEALRGVYDAGRMAVITAQRYIDAFAKTGRGAALVDAGVTVIEAAVQEVRAETERLVREVSDVVEGDQVAPDQSGPTDSGLGRAEAEESEGAAGVRGSAPEANGGEVEADRTP